MSLPPGVSPFSAQRNTIPPPCIQSVVTQTFQLLQADTVAKRSSPAFFHIWMMISSPCATSFLNFPNHLWWINWNLFPSVKLTQQNKRKMGRNKGGSGCLEGCFVWHEFGLYWLKMLVRLLPEYLHHHVGTAAVRGCFSRRRGYKVHRR